MEELNANVQTLSDFFKQPLETFIDELTLLKRAILTFGGVTDGRSRFQNLNLFLVLETQKIGELPLEHGAILCCGDTHVEEWVTISCVCLAGNAKLWWHAWVDDNISAGRILITTWGVLKNEVRQQFLPCIVAWLARKSLRILK